MGGKKSTMDDWRAAVIAIWVGFSAKNGEKPNLNAICKAHGVSTNLGRAMREHGFITGTRGGMEWTGPAACPSDNDVAMLREAAGELNRQRKPKAAAPVQVLMPAQPSYLQRPLPIDPAMDPFLDELRAMREMIDELQGRYVAALARMEVSA